MKALFSTRRVQRVRHETRPREVEVLRVEPLSPNFVAVTFGGESLLGAAPLAAGEGFTCCAGEGRVRQVVLNEKGLPPESVRISLSWTEGDSAFHETLANPAEQPARREAPRARGNFSLSHDNA